jgi:hypothetical protein
MKTAMIKKAAIVIATTFLGFKSFGQTTQNIPFNLKVTNVKDEKSTIHVGFYKKENNFPTQQQHAFAKEIGPGKKGEIYVTWNDVPEGEYSLAIYQDIDNSGRMKTNMFGYPKEPFGFSQNFKPKMSKPKFNQCMITFNSNSNYFEVKLID